jgi:hypothetical protein
MIPDIGIMMAAYIVTRMVGMLGQPNAQANVIAKVLAVITILITLGAAADLLQKGSSTNLLAPELTR